MKLRDIDLHDIKVAVFDFDDTLAVHKDKNFSEHRNKTEEDKIEFYVNAYKEPKRFYDEIEPCERSEKLYNLIEELRKKEIKVYCLSGMEFSFNLKAKQNFVNKYYGEDIEVISAAKQELKLKGLKIIAKINECKLKEMLFVDDRESVIELLAENGVKAVKVDEVER